MGVHSALALGLDALIMNTLEKPQPHLQLFTPVGAVWFHRVVISITSPRHLDLEPDGLPEHLLTGYLARQKNCSAAQKHPLTFYSHTY